jgi:hypothetical protein
LNHLAGYRDKPSEEKLGDKTMFRAVLTGETVAGGCTTDGVLQTGDTAPALTVVRPREQWDLGFESDIVSYLLGYHPDRR